MSDGPARDAEAPATLAMQPIPLDVHIAHDRRKDGCTTALVRTWREGDTARCRLCPRDRCKAYAGVCLVQVKIDVPDEQARMFSTVGLQWPNDRLLGAGGKHPGFINLDRVEVTERPRDPLQEHRPEPLGGIAL